MKIKIQQFLQQNHSWACVGWNMARILIQQGHIVHLLPTDSDKGNYLPEDLKKHVISQLNQQYDLQISYTAPINFGKYLSSGAKNRFGIWVYEFGHGLPNGFAKNHIYTDKILVPSNYGKQIFLDAKTPENKLEVVPHGITLSDYENKTPFKLKTNKKYKVGAVIAQPHLRKNIPGLLEAYGRAFTKNDDVCLVLKVSPNRKKDQIFTVDFWEIYKDFLKKYPKAGEIELITDFIEDMATIYLACDTFFTMSHAEGWYLPGTEAIGARKLNIAPKHGGQLDFLNENNSLLINGKIGRADKRALYWASTPYASWFVPEIDHAAELLKLSYNKYDELMQKFIPSINETREKFTWEKAVNQILELTK